MLGKSSENERKKKIKAEKELWMNKCVCTVHKSWENRERKRKGRQNRGEDVGKTSVSWLLVILFFSRCFCLTKKKICIRTFIFIQQNWVGGCGGYDVTWKKYRFSFLFLHSMSSYYFDFSSFLLYYYPYTRIHTYIHIYKLYSLIIADFRFLFG